MAKKLAGNDGSEAQGGSSKVDWDSFSKLCSDNSSSSTGTVSFGSKGWASVYLASTPQQAAEFGLKFPGVDEVNQFDVFRYDWLRCFPCCMFLHFNT